MLGRGGFLLAVRTIRRRSLRLLLRFHQWLENSNLFLSLGNIDSRFRSGRGIEHVLLVEVQRLLVIAGLAVALGDVPQESGTGIEIETRFVLLGGFGEVTELELFSRLQEVSLRLVAFVSECYATTDQDQNQ